MMSGMTLLLELQAALGELQAALGEPQAAPGEPQAALGESQAAHGSHRVVTPVPDAFVTDWLGRRGSADVLVRPTTVEQVSRTVAICRDFGAAIIPMGGNTGLVGSTIADLAQPTVVVSLAELTDCVVDARAGTAIVGSGVTLADLQQAAVAAGWYYGVDLAARDSATVGGTIATNAGGMHVCAYGSTRAQLMGIQAVLADGSVIDDLRGLPKDNTGYSLRDLLCGSEGTLGIVTAACLKLHRPPGPPLTLGFPVDSLAAAIDIAHAASTSFRLLAGEVVDGRSWRDSAPSLGARDPIADVAAGYILIVELDIGRTDPESAVDTLAADLTHAAESALTSAAGAISVDEVVVAVDEPERRALWRVREGQAEWWTTLRAGGRVLHKYDITLPLPALDSAVGRIGRELSTRVDRWGVFGHVVEGSLHLQATSEPDLTLDRTVLSIVSEFGGSLSAEHGVGRDKAEMLSLRRSPVELAAMTAVKRALDPTGLFNPGAILPQG